MQSQAIRWTREQACREFKINPRTLAGRLTRKGVRPGADGKFSTAQILGAVYRPEEAEKLRLVREQADRVALENAAARREMVSTAAVRYLIPKAARALLRAIEDYPGIEAEDREKMSAPLRNLEAEVETLCGQAAPGAPC